MTVAICLILFIAALTALWVGWYLASKVLLLATFAIVFLIGSGLCARMLLGINRVAAPLSAVHWQSRNSIVLLGSGTLAPEFAGDTRIPLFAYSRILTTAQAYFECRRRALDCEIIVSGGDPQRHGVTEAAVYSAALQGLNIPGHDIRLEERSNSTWQNASNVTQLVARDRALIIVASGFQLKRALLYFSHFRSGVEGIASDRLSVALKLVPFARNFFATDILLHEQIGIARYFLYNALGWNAPKTPQSDMNLQGSTGTPRG